MKHECLVIGGPRDGARVAVYDLPNIIRLDDAVEAVFSTSLATAATATPTVVRDAPQTTYYREVLRTGDERWYVYVAERIPRDEVIPELLAGYRQAAKVERA